MAAVLAFGLAIWFLGRLFGLPARLRLIALGFLYVAVVLGHLVLPEGAALRAATGGRAEGWLVLGGVALLVWGYRRLLRGMRAKAVPAPGVTAAEDRLSEAELERYARHVLLREVGGAGQRRLKAARVLVIGAGGLGSPAILYLAAAGVGTIGVIDDDRVEASNLQRQILHADDRIGLPKVQSALIAARALNPHVTLRPYQRRFDADVARDLVADYDLVLDGCDSFETRALVNATCVALGKPLVSAAITQWEGQIGLYDPARGGPCLACIFPEAPAAGLVPTCAEAGVVAPLPGVLGTMMALEAVKVITGAGAPLRGRLMLYDGLQADARVIATRRRADCAVCGDHNPG